MRHGAGTRLGPLESGRTRALALAAMLSLTFQSCVFRRVTVDSVPTRPPVAVTTPVKAHLKDGSTIVYAKGVRVESDALVGAGTRYDLTLSHPEAVSHVPLESVVAMETFRQQLKPAESAVGVLLGAAAAAVGTAALAVAIFGSCPTVYSSTDGVETLEAETFSYSIAPLLESRDLDRLQTGADGRGQVRLEVRNEALETHDINHLQLLEVRHSRDEVVVPDQDGRPVTLGGFADPEEALDRAGRDVRARLALADGDAYATAPAVLARAGSEDMEDWLELALPLPERADHLGLVLRARNSLLNTVLFYEVMLARAGPRALDWLGADLGRIGETVELGRWVRRRLGLHVQLYRNGTWQEVARLADPGPIAWRDVAVVVPVTPGSPVARLRLSFAADAWRIDRLRVAARTQEAEARGVVLKQVLSGGNVDEQEACALLREPDGRYLETRPGQRFTAVFDVGAEPVQGSRTFLLSSQGYYTEWLRREWLRGGTRQAFVPSDEALFEALRRWRERRVVFEQAFESNRVRVP